MAFNQRVFRKDKYKSPNVRTLCVVKIKTLFER